MKNIRNFVFLTGVVSLCATFLYSQEQKDVKIPLPQKPREEDIVSLDLAKKVGLLTAQKKFGPGVIGEPMIGYDLNGNIRVYIIPFRIGKSVFPDESEIVRNLDEARRLLPKAKRELAEVREVSLGLKSEEIKFERRGKKMFLKKNAE